jgi:hypothetical protein
MPAAMTGPARVRAQVAHAGVGKRDERAELFMKD